MTSHAKLIMHFVHVMRYNLERILLFLEYERLLSLRLGISIFCE